MQPTVYIMASRRNGTLYVGVTSDPVRRVWQHRNDLAAGFTRRHRVHLLVYFERHTTMFEAIRREKQIKEWRRDWKLAVIEAMNLNWIDLWPMLVGSDEAGPRLSPG